MTILDMTIINIKHHTSYFGMRSYIKTDKILEFQKYTFCKIEPKIFHSDFFGEVYSQLFET